MITYGFAFYLTVAVIVTGIVTLLDKVFWSKTREGKPGVIVDYSRSLFPVLLVVWVIRSFIIQPYRVPSGSLEPTILPGDFIAVSQFSYGIRLPVFNYKIIPVGEPKRGQIALFHFPLDPNITFVKRVIGLPGDHIVYKNKRLWINGKEIPEHYLGQSIDYGDAPGQMREVNVYEENLDGVKHKIFVQPVGGETQNIDVTVPKDRYFMMGDNRDNSDDSRVWGFVPERNLIGRAFGIWMSWDPINHSIRWRRIGEGVD